MIRNNDIFSLNATDSATVFYKRWKIFTCFYISL